MLKSVANSQSSRLVHSFEDAVYNRTSYYFLGGNLQESVLNLADAAFRSIDFTTHQGTHPTLGTVDHISFVPLENATISEATQTANAFCRSFMESFQVPMYSYGDLSPHKTRLRDLRKELGYFEGQTQAVSSTNILTPTYAPTTRDATKGIACVGVVPFVLNFNIRFRVSDPRQKVTQITQFLRSTHVRDYDYQATICDFKI